MPQGFKLNGPNLSTKPRIKFTPKIDGRKYAFDLRWNSRFEYWEMTISSDDGDLLLVGCKVVADWDMFSPFSDIRLPPGLLFCKDGDNKGENPGRDDFRKRHHFLYVDPLDPVPTGVKTLPSLVELPP